ncbi:MAG: glutamate--tRNA ligase [Oscillospiraceae bacterium]|jgi:glutamyl-tRNA synthetase|nr:glutamate--tRNA ligase [Oscillospiraceae bacterium]
MSKRVADALFPDIKMTYQEAEALYPPRNLPEGAVCTRFAPSPTGFMHIGGLYTALLNRIFTQSRGGVFFLRIEDTDQKRQIENGVTEIINALGQFQIHFDEGAVGEAEDSGRYGPYRQSLRREIYQAFAKYLVEIDRAYPCFCTSDELEAIREKQEAAEALQKGYYGEWAACRELDEEAVLKRIANGDRWIVRMRSGGRLGVSRVYHDMIRGDISMQENILDVVIIKGDGLPTYHFAHVVDDHLMRTTDVIRADEWIASIPLHVEMFEMLGFPVPRYTHLSPIMKNEAKEDGEGVSRRKLSKRKDPEARVGYYDEAGYPIPAVLDYLLTIGSADYEPWREENMDASIFEFSMDLSKSGAAGALFDFDKLNNVAKKRVGHMSEEQIFASVSAWAERYDDKLNSFIQNNGDIFRKSISVWHEKRLDVAKWSDLMKLYPYMYDPAFAVDTAALPEPFLPHMARIPDILADYLRVFDYDDDATEWFNKVKEVATKHNYCVKMGAYKKHPEEYNGSIADLSSFIRYALTGTTNTPDLHGIIHVIGRDAAVNRVTAFLEKLANR